MFDELILPGWLVPILKPGFHRVAACAKRYSMVSRKRMQNLWRLIHRLDRHHIKGGFVEMGVAQGGTAVILASRARQSRLPRQVWLCDAFEEASPPQFYYADVERLLFHTLQFDPRQVRLVKGWFDRALLTYPGDPISFLHIDAGGYQPVKSCLDVLLPFLEKGGYVVLDNYGVDEGCRQAVQETLHQPAHNWPLQRFGRTQAYFQSS
jgi:O-methyltransferase